jgi:hypothetical protein
MKFLVVALLPLACLSFSGCHKPPAKSPATPAVAPAPPPPPPQNEVMVCRDSRTGAKAECGAAGAVMVGMKPE